MIDSVALILIGVFIGVLLTFGIYTALNKW